VSEHKHTPGPWRYRRVGLGSTWWVEDADGVSLFSVWLPSQDDGEPTCPQWLAVLRTIACVNALDGIPDPAAFVERAGAVVAALNQPVSAQQLFGIVKAIQALEDTMRPGAPHA
jgi:hypothetical protein